jgi:hypothetical protein
MGKRREKTQKKKRKEVVVYGDRTKAHRAAPTWEVPGYETPRRNFYPGVCFEGRPITNSTTRPGRSPGLLKEAHHIFHYKAPEAATATQDHRHTTAVAFEPSHAKSEEMVHLKILKSHVPCFLRHYHRP